MKRLWIILMCLICVPSIAAAQVWIEAQQNYIVYDNATLDGSRPQQKLLLGWKYVYLWGSMDGENSIDYGGQEGVNFKLPGIGAGIRIPLVKYLSAYLEGGYFKPDYDDGWYSLGGSTKSATAWEGLNIYGNDKVGTAYAPAWWKYAQTEIDGGFGGEVGINFNYPLIWGFDLMAKTGYRYLKLDQHVWLVDAPADKALYGWAFDDQLDLSGWIMGVGLKYEF